MPSPLRAIPADLRARLDLLALFRTLDEIDLSPGEILKRFIRRLFELVAGYVEAFWL